MVVKKLTCSSYISSITPVLCWSGTESGVHCNNVWCASIYFSALYGIIYTVSYSVHYAHYAKKKIPALWHCIDCDHCGLYAALWGSVALWRAGSAILTPFGSIFLSGSHLNLNKSYFFQIQIASIFSQTMPTIRYIAGAFCRRIYSFDRVVDLGRLRITESAKID